MVPALQRTTPRRAARCAASGARTLVRQLLDGKPLMHRFLAFMLVAALAGPALAQDQPKSLKTVRIHEPAAGSPNLYVIVEDGTVRIDWPAVETLAASKADRTVLPLAQLMLAIRDGTWKPAR